MFAALLTRIRIRLAGVVRSAGAPDKASAVGDGPAGHTADGDGGAASTRTDPRQAVARQPVARQAAAPGSGAQDWDLQACAPEAAVVEIPVTGELDLHTFRPSEVGIVVPEYLRVCRERGILEVRVIHGKGTGALRRSVEAVVTRMPQVASYRTAGHDRGSWGATVVHLHPLEADPPDTEVE